MSNKIVKLSRVLDVQVIKGSEVHILDIETLLDEKAPFWVRFIDIDDNDVLGYFPLTWITKSQIAVYNDRVYVTVPAIDLETIMSNVYFSGEKLPQMDEKGFEKTKKVGSFLSRKSLLSTKQTAKVMAFANCKLLDKSINHGITAAAMLYEYYLLIKYTRMVERPLTVLQKLYYAIMVEKVINGTKMSKKLWNWVKDMVTLHYDELNVETARRSKTLGKWLKTAKELKSEMEVYNKILLKVLDVDFA